MRRVLKSFICDTADFSRTAEANERKFDAWWMKYWRSEQIQVSSQPMLVLDEGSLRSSGPWHLVLRHVNVASSIWQFRTCHAFTIFVCLLVSCKASGQLFEHFQAILSFFVFISHDLLLLLLFSTPPTQAAGQCWQRARRAQCLCFYSSQCPHADSGAIQSASWDVVVHTVVNTAQSESPIGCRSSRFFPSAISALGTPGIPAAARCTSHHEPPRFA